MSELDVMVHGATGVQGAAIIDRLRRDGRRAAAISRTAQDESADGPTIAATLDDPDSLRSAYFRTNAVVVQLPLVFSPDVIRYAEHVLDALQTSDVQRVVINLGSPVPPEPIGVPHLDAKTLLVSRIHDVVPHATVVGRSVRTWRTCSSPRPSTASLAARLRTRCQRRLRCRGWPLTILPVWSATP
jgi:hypothetical protein